MSIPTLHSSAVALSFFHWPLPAEDGAFETWSQVVARVIERQRWLWERALARTLNEKETAELEELSKLLLRRAILPDGRTLWLSGSELSRQRESCMFNSAFTNVETVYDVVDLFWLLLQGCSIGFYPVTGTLNGFRCPLESIEVIRSSRNDSNGCKYNVESFDSSGLWTIKVGDTAEAFAKAIGKLLAGKYPAKKLIVDLSEIRPAGCRLKGYGWESTGDAPLALAFRKIAEILSDRSDQLLTKDDILNIIHLLNMVPASMQTASLALVEYGQAEWKELIQPKKTEGSELAKRALLFHARPSKEELNELFHLILESGGDEPNLINATEASRRAPWFKGCNPTGEVLLGNKSLCTCVEVNLLSFKGDKAGLERALYLAARMNYRQTLISLRDEILQEAWDLNNEFLHLCGVSLTGIRGRRDLTAYDFKRMRNTAVSAAFGMAGELNTPLPKNVTCVKPSRNLSRSMGTYEWGDVPEGINLPLGKYLFHYMILSSSDPATLHLRNEGYHISEKPYSPHLVLVKCPVSYSELPFSTIRRVDKLEKIEDLEINTESAIDQLGWYAKLQDTWAEQNVSQTVHYDPSEVPAIIDWLYENWESYVGVSFQFRQDARKNAEEMGLPYLEHEVVSEEVYRKYVAELSGDLDRDKA